MKFQAWKELHQLLLAFKNRGKDHLPRHIEHLWNLKMDSRWQPARKHGSQLCIHKKLNSVDNLNNKKSDSRTASSKNLSPVPTDLCHSFDLQTYKIRKLYCVKLSFWYCVVAAIENKCNQDNWKCIAKLVKQSLKYFNRLLPCYHSRLQILTS